MKLKAANPIFVVPNVADTLEWYAANLGFQIIVNSSGYGVMRRDALEIHLMPVHKESGATNPNHRVKAAASDVYVVVEDVDTLHANCTARGLNIPRPLETQAKLSREFVMEDLNGYRLCFSQEFKNWRNA